MVRFKLFFNFLNKNEHYWMKYMTNNYWQYVSGLAAVLELYVVSSEFGIQNMVSYKVYDALMLSK